MTLTPRFTVTRLFYIITFTDLTSDTLRRYPNFDVVVGLAWSYDPESYTDGSAATGGASPAGQVKGDETNKKISWSSELGVGRGSENHMS